MKEYNNSESKSIRVNITEEILVKVITPDYKLKTGIFMTWYTMAANVVSSKDLIWELFKRDFINVYKRTIFGISWVIISPLIGIISWVLLNSAGVLSPGETGIPYPAYVLVSTTIWGLFLGFFTSSSNTLTSGKGFIDQVEYPHEALLIKQISEHIANFSITLIVTFSSLLIFGVYPDWKIIFLPILMLPLLFLGSAIGLLSSMISVVALDVNKILTTLFGFLMYLTPVIYSADTDSKLLSSVIKYIPLSYLVGGVRDLILYGNIDYWAEFLALSFVSFLFFLFALRVFYVAEDLVIEKIV